MSEGENNNDEEKKQITEEFVEVVKSWVKIDDDIREKQASLKELRTEKKEYEEFILEFMDQIDEKVITITDGNLRKNKSKTKKGLKPELIQNALFDITKDNNKSIEMTNYILDKRETVERVNLKRTKFRKPKVKDV
tara:strand:- start:1020 stop:1427 length:408 start_codon:yes stop_codon:yes gene_type:complete